MGRVGESSTENLVILPLLTHVYHSKDKGDFCLSSLREESKPTELSSSPLFSTSFWVKWGVHASDKPQNIPLKQPEQLHPSCVLAHTFQIKLSFTHLLINFWCQFFLTNFNDIFSLLKWTLSGYHQIWENYWMLNVFILYKLLIYILYPFFHGNCFLNDFNYFI